MSAKNKIEILVHLLKHPPGTTISYEKFPCELSPCHLILLCLLFHDPDTVSVAQYRAYRWVNQSENSIENLTETGFLIRCEAVI